MIRALRKTTRGRHDGNQRVAYQNTVGAGVTARHSRNCQCRRGAAATAAPLWYHRYFNGADPTADTVNLAPLSTDVVVASGGVTMAGARQ